MMTSTWKRIAPWVAAILVGFSLLPPVATADDGAASAVDSEGMTAQATAEARPVLVSGVDHTLLLQPGGVVWGWGDNMVGQLAAGEQPQVPTPTLVPGLNTGIKSIAAGQHHSLAVASDGAVWGWGYNGSGQVTGTDDIVLKPTKIKNVSGVTAIAAGHAHSVALKSGRVLAWGGNAWGQLGRGNWDDSGNPAAVPNLTNVVAIAAGGEHTLALKADGSVWAWGGNDGGSLGDGTVTDRSTPFKVQGLPKVARIAAGANTSFALTADGTLWGWGGNHYGALGNGSFSDQLVPMQLMTNVALVTPGGQNTLVAKKDGTVWGWGYNDSGQLGYIGVNSSVPVEIAVPGQVTALIAGYNHSLALTADGSIFGWGSNYGGQLGTGGPAQLSPTPALTALGLAITSHTAVGNVIRLSTNKVTLAGVTYPKASVAADIAGTTRTATADASGKFTFKDLTFPSGQETIVGLTANTEYGASWTRHEFHMMVDNAPPQVLGASVRLRQTDGSETIVALTKNGNSYSGTVTAAADTVLHIAVDEPLSMITVNPNFKKFIIAQDGYDITIGDLKKGANKVTVQLTDLVGKKSNLTLQLNYEAGPIMTITTPRTSPLFGAPKNGASTIPVEFSGTADEKVARLLVVDAATGDAVTEVDMTGAPKTSWKVTIQHDAAQAGVWKYRFLGVDQTGYTSKPSATNADVRTVTIDPFAPQLSMTSPYDQLVFTDGDDPHFAVENKKLIFEGVATDDHSGVKQVSVGKTKATPVKNSDPNNYEFKIPVALTDNGLTVVPLSAEDAVGNKSDVLYFGAVMKTKIRKITGSASFIKSTGALHFAGETDPAINIGTSKEPIFVARVYPDFELVDYKPLPGRAGSNSSGVAPPIGRKWGMSPATADEASAQVVEGGVINLVTGKYWYDIDFSDPYSWPDGTYTWRVVAPPPFEFPDLTPLKTKSFAVTIRR